MAQLLVRNLEPEIVEALKSRARTNHRSLEAEAREILSDAALAARRRHEFLASVVRARELIGDRMFDDSSELIREDRER
jgi:plasmid stability protein